MTQELPKDGQISNSSGRTFSLWMECELPTFPSLKNDLTTDICIVGAGIIGLTCAYTLAKNGQRVVILEQGAIAGGQSARTTGHLTWVLDDRFKDLESYFGKKGSKLAAESHAAAIDYIEKIVNEENIDCDFERLDGYLFVPPEDSLEILDEELTCIKKTGMSVSKLARTPISTSFDAGPCLHFPRQAQFHVLKYLKGLIKAILKYDVKIFCHTHVSHFEDGSPCFVKTDQNKVITANSVIVSTCTPVNDRITIHTKQSAYRTYVIAVKVPRGSVHKGLYWDTPDPYHYVRLQKNIHDHTTDWLIIGGEDHKVGQEDAIDAKYDILEAWASTLFPQMGKIEYRWSGQIFEPADSLAFIGRNPGNRNTYIATGDSGNGLTHGTIAGILIPDLILENPNPWEELYSPHRKTLKAANEYIKENLNTALQYRDWFTPGELKQIQQLKQDEGLILREGLKKIAVYKDRKNHIHVNSAFCPHLAGCVRWNDGEKSWDCPCHGSRFDGKGKVINGPAISNLRPTNSKFLDT